MPGPRFVFEPNKKPETPPTLSEPLTEDQIIQLVDYLRRTKNADAVAGYNMCREINKTAIDMIRQFLPDANAWYLHCEQFYGIARTPYMACEHFTGVVELADCYMWFDGTADQLAVERENVITITSESIESLVTKVTNRLGNKWRLINP